MCLSRLKIDKLLSGMKKSILKMMSLSVSCLKSLPTLIDSMLIWIAYLYLDDSDDLGSQALKASISRFQNQLDRFVERIICKESLLQRLAPFYMV